MTPSDRCDWKNAGLIALVACMAMPAVSAMAAESIGTATEIARRASASGEGARRELGVGSPVAALETISTDAVGKAAFRFRDDTQLSVGPGSTIRLDSFAFSEADAPSSFVIRAVKGAFRFATGRGDHDAYRIQTPLATVGVRGTQFTVDIEKEQVRVSVTDGAVVLCPNGGRPDFADCVEAGVGQSILSGRTRARVVPTASLPQRRADLLPLRNVADTARALPAALGDTLRDATDTAGRTVRDLADDASSLPLPTAASGAAVGGSAGRTAAAVGGAVGGAKATAGVPQGLGGTVGNAAGGGLNGAEGAAAGGGLGGVGGAVGGAVGGIGGVGGLLGR